MGECFKCGISGSRVLLRDAIVEEGIVKFCRKCLEEERLPAIKKVVEEDASKLSVYERLSRTRGINPKEHKERISSFGNNSVHDCELRDLVEANYANKVKQVEKRRRDDLADNFHWVIMRARRSMKMTPEQVAVEIGEPLNAIRLAEKGIVPEGDNRLVKKLENLLRINILKNVQRADFKRPELDLDEPDVTRILTLSDLQEMKKKKDMEKVVEKDDAEKFIPKKKTDWFGFLRRRKQKIQFEEELALEEPVDHLDDDDFGEIEIAEVKKPERVRRIPVRGEEISANKFEKTKSEKKDVSDEDISGLIWKR